MQTIVKHSSAAFPLKVKMIAIHKRRYPHCYILKHSVLILYFGIKKDRKRKKKSEKDEDQEYIVWSSTCTCKSICILLHVSVSVSYPHLHLDTYIKIAVIFSSLIVITDYRISPFKKGTYIRLCPVLKK